MATNRGMKLTLDRATLLSIRLWHYGLCAVVFAAMLAGEAAWSLIWSGPPVYRVYYYLGGYGLAVMLVVCGVLLFRRSKTKDLRFGGALRWIVAGITAALYLFRVVLTIGGHAVPYGGDADDTHVQKLTTIGILFAVGFVLAQTLRPDSTDRANASM